jgi:hypothetical protein
MSCRLTTSFVFIPMIWILRASRFGGREMKLKLFSSAMLLIVSFSANVVQAQEGRASHLEGATDSLDPTRIVSSLPALQPPQVPSASEHWDADGKSKPYRFQTVDFPGAAYSEAYDISDGNKTVVGFTLYDPGTTPHISFTLKGTNYKTVSIPGSSDNGLTGINHSGQMVGFYFDSSGNLHGFSDDGGNFTSIDYPGAIFTEAIDINDSGLVAGWYADATTDHGFTYNGSKFTEIDYPGSIGTAAYGINSAGEVVGVWFDQSGNEHSFLLSGGTFTSLDYPGAHITQASGINDSGEIAGTYRDSNNVVHGFIYSGGTWGTVDVAGAGATGLNRIKNNHEVVGWFSDAIGETHGVIGH